MIFFTFLISLITYHLSSLDYARDKLFTKVYAHSETQIIKMTPNGFEPNEVTIDTNSTVIFVNQDKVQRWPASNIHPTHTLYPEKGGCIGSKFDACGGVKPGEAYEFVFEQKGSWGYHDHLRPGLQGVIIIK